MFKRMSAQEKAYELMRKATRIVDKARDPVLRMAIAMTMFSYAVALEYVPGAEADEEIERVLSKVRKDIADIRAERVSDGSGAHS